MTWVNPEDVDTTHLSDTDFQRIESEFLAKIEENKQAILKKDLLKQIKNDEQLMKQEAERLAKIELDKKEKERWSKIDGKREYDAWHGRNQ